MSEAQQGNLLRQAREKLGLTVEGLADELGVSIHTMRSWLLPEDSKKHRKMPKTARLLLDRIMAEARKKKA
jgi:transcriptional regulator with XRE-family HTH domain